MKPSPLHSSGLRTITATESLAGKLRYPNLFLAGGITGCPDWQEEALDLLADSGRTVTALNPRRPNFPIHDPSAALEQIQWEHKALRAADAILFWFCAETVQPIVLYELGAWSMTNKPIFVGVHPDYPRRQDVEIQTSLVRSRIMLQRTLPALVHQALSALASATPGAAERSQGPTDREWSLILAAALAWSVGRFEGMNVDPGYAGEVLEHWRSPMFLLTPSPAGTEGEGS